MEGIDESLKVVDWNGRQVQSSGGKNVKREGGGAGLYREEEEVEEAMAGGTGQSRNIRLRHTKPLDTRGVFGFECIIRHLHHVQHTFITDILKKAPPRRFNQG